MTAWEAMGQGAQHNWAVIKTNEITFTHSTVDVVRQETDARSLVRSHNASLTQRDKDAGWFFHYGPTAQDAWSKPAADVEPKKAKKSGLSEGLLPVMSTKDVADNEDDDD